VLQNVELVGQLKIDSVDGNTGYDVSIEEDGSVTFPPTDHLIDIGQEGHPLEIGAFEYVTLRCDCTVPKAGKSLRLGYDVCLRTDRPNPGIQYVEFSQTSPGTAGFVLHNVGLGIPSEPDSRGWIIELCYGNLLPPSGSWENSLWKRHRENSAWSKGYNEDEYGPVYSVSPTDRNNDYWLSQLPDDEYDEGLIEECSKWCADWTPPGRDDTVGLLWDADEGSLTVYINRERKGIANVNKWCGEIRGQLCWTAEGSITADGEPEGVAMAADSVNFHIQRQPPPILTDNDKAAKEKERLQMAARLNEKLMYNREMEDLCCCGPHPIAALPHNYGTPYEY